MAARPRATFAHTKTVHLIVEDNMEITALEIVRSLPDFKDDITGIVPNFGGKCFDITLSSTEAATRLATSGFDYGAERKPLKLLGAKTIHVSVFVAVQFPDQEIVKFLKEYGQLKSENLRRLCYNEEGFRNIERGIHMAEFTSLDKDLPRKVVTQGLEIFFKYPRQPITCYRCGSTEHVGKNCPNQRSRFNHIRVEDRVLTERDRDRKEKEREDREREDRKERERRKHDKYSERRYKDDDGYRREERNDRYRSSRDRSSHRDHESNDSGSES